MAEDAIWNLKLNDSLLGLNGVQTIADDIIVFGVGDSKDEAMKDHDHSFKALLERCLARNIKLNEEKMKFKVSRVQVCWLYHFRGRSETRS